MGLDAYEARRHFDRTPEPRGGQRRRAAGPLQFVVQKHDARHLHYDLRLELDGVLLSWAVPKGPSLDPGQRRLAMRTEDHPFDYVGFEGVIPEGQYGGGTVMVWDRGTWTPDGDARAGLRRGDLTFSLEGEKLRGAWRLVRLPPKPPDRGRGREAWMLMKRRGASATGPEAEPLGEARPLSVVSGRDLDEIARDPGRVWRSDRGGEPGGERPATPEDALAGARRRGVSSAAARRGGAKAPRRVEGSRVDAARVEGSRRGALPETPEPQLATLAEAPPAGAGWLHEVKHDGYRLLARKAGTRVRLITRGGLDWTRRFAAIAAEIARLPCEAALLDGEVVVLDRRGVSDFQRLQRALSSGGVGGAMRFVAFDLVHLDGRDLARSPLVARKEALGRLLAGRPRDRAAVVALGEHLQGEGRDVLAGCCRLGLEGVVSKRADSRYEPGKRARTWLKVKCHLRQELVVVGFTEPEGARPGFGALVLGVPVEEPPRQTASKTRTRTKTKTKTKTKTRRAGASAAGGLRCSLAGRVGTGFDDAELRALRARLEPLRRDTPPVEHPPRGAQARGITWVEPRLVVEVAFAGWTGDGHVRQASFRGMREDKRPGEVRRELAAPARESGARRPPRKGSAVERVGGVEVTHPARVIFPEAGITKVELLRYYAHVAERMLPHAARRPLTLIRCPGGRQRCFYQKHAKASLPDSITRVPIEEGGVVEEYLALSGPESLLALAQHGVVEFHLWGCRTDRLERPDRLVIDLDPGPELGWDAVVWAARLVRARLDALGLRSFVLSTGGHGLHVVLPIERRTDWAGAKGFAHAFARKLSRELPDVFSDLLKKRGREGLIFLDYLRNDFQASAVSPFSVRARPGGPVAVTLAWDELDPEQAPTFTVRDGEELARRVDPWADYFDVRQALTKARVGAVTRR